MQEKSKAGRKFIFDTEEEFLDKFEEYIKKCEDSGRLANIAGFAAYCRMHRDVFYTTKRRFPWAGGMIENILEDYTINADINHILKIFYMKCKFKYNDRPEDDGKEKNRVVIVDDLPDSDEDERED